MRVEEQIELIARRSQEQLARLAGCDPSRISRKAARVGAGDASWVEALSGAQLLSLARADSQIGAAVVLMVEGRALPSGDPASLPLDVDDQIAGSADLQRTWNKAQADHKLTAVEIDNLLQKAQRHRDTMQRLVRNLVAARKAARS
jgi:hypothetical protein